MNLLDALRHAERQGKSRVQRGTEAVRRRISGRTVVEAPSAPKARTGIVSINGRDVEKMHCTGGGRTV